MEVIQTCVELGVGWWSLDPMSSGIEERNAVL
jgi:hypothetical protein